MYTTKILSKISNKYFLFLFVFLISSHNLLAMRTVAVRVARTLTCVRSTPPAAGGFGYVAARQPRTHRAKPALVKPHKKSREEGCRTCPTRYLCEAHDVGYARSCDVQEKKEPEGDLVEAFAKLSCEEKQSFLDDGPGVYPSGPSEISPEIKITRELIINLAREGRLNSTHVAKLPRSEQDKVMHFLVGQKIKPDPVFIRELGKAFEHFFNNLERSKLSSRGKKIVAKLDEFRKIENPTTHEYRAFQHEIFAETELLFKPVQRGGVEFVLVYSVAFLLATSWELYGFKRTALGVAAVVMTGFVLGQVLENLS